MRSRVTTGEGTGDWSDIQGTKGPRSAPPTNFGPSSPVQRSTTVAHTQGEVFTQELHYLRQQCCDAAAARDRCSRLLDTTHNPAIVPLHPELRSNKERTPVDWLVGLINTLVTARMKESRCWQPGQVWVPLQYIIGVQYPRSLLVARPRGV